MKKYIFPGVILAALLGHLAYNLLHTDQFVFDTSPVLEQAELAAQQHVRQQPKAIHPVAGITTLATASSADEATPQPVLLAE